MSQDLLETIALQGIPSARGRRPAPLELSFVRELNEGDLEVLLNPPAKGVVTSPIARLRHTHHLLARCLAEGRKPSEVSLITGYSLSRISILQNDPSVKELVAYYAENAAEQYLDVHARLAALGVSTLEELQERLEAEPEKFTQNQLMQLAELTLDRSVAPPKGGGKGGGAGAPAVNFNISFETPSAPVVTIEQPRLGASED